MQGNRYNYLNTLESFSSIHMIFYVNMILLDWLNSNFSSQTLMKNPKARCGPKKICYLAKPCRHSNECSAGFVCKIPGIIKKAKRAQRAQIIKNHMKRVHQSRRRSRDRKMLNKTLNSYITYYILKGFLYLTYDEY